MEPFLEEKLAAVGLTDLMSLSSGHPMIRVGVIDGPILESHPDLAAANILKATTLNEGSCSLSDSTACQHGTFIAGMLSASRTSEAPAICPGCTLLVRPIFLETADGEMPSAKPDELAEAVFDCVDAGAKVINLSLALADDSLNTQRELKEALDFATRKGVITVAAAGNQGFVSSSVITQHPGVIAVVASNLEGQPLGYSNLSHSTGKRGLCAPGGQVMSLGTDGQTLTMAGTSVATPFVTSTIALLWSTFPTATTSDIKEALLSTGHSRRSIVPPLLNAWRSYQHLQRRQSQIGRIQGLGEPQKKNG
jgi:subtilisin family serine protease